MTPNSAAAVILRCAQTLARRGPIRLSDLIVEAWKQDPKRLGIPHYEDQYPDAHRIACYLSGRRGLVSEGYLYREGPNTYLLDYKGVVLGEPHGTLPRADDKVLTALWDSEAFTKDRGGKKEEISYTEACACWGIAGEGEPSERLEAIEGVLRLAQGVEHEIRLWDGRILSEGDVRGLGFFQEYLRERYPFLTGKVKKKGA